MKPFHAFLAAVLAFSAAGSWAQWQWLDKDGRKVFSDRAPGAEIPEKNILKRPSGLRPAPAAPVAATEDAAAAPGAPAAAPAAPASAVKGAGVDKDLEAKKKQAAEAEAAKRKADEERIAKAKADNCARAKQAKATFESGMRVSRTNAAGEREVMDEAARAAEVKRIQGIIDADCR